MFDRFIAINLPACLATWLAGKGSGSGMVVVVVTAVVVAVVVVVVGGAA